MRSKAKKLTGVQFPAALSGALEMKEKQAAPTAMEEVTLRERALLVRFSIGRWYGSGSDEEVVNEIRAAKDATGEIGSFTKRLMKREHLAEINRVTAESRRYHKTLTLPWGESGQRILSVEAYREYKETMSKYEGEFFAAVERFMAKYDELVIAEKKNLGELWKASDYPTPEAMREHFRYGLIVEVLPSTHDLRLQLSQAHADEIKREQEQRLHATLHHAVTDIYERLREEVAEAKAKLDDPDARLQGKMFGALSGVIALLPKLNIAHDPKLTALGRELQKELIALPVDEMRKSTTARQSASHKAQKMLDAINILKGK